MAVELLNLKISIYKYKTFCKIIMYVHEMLDETHRSMMLLVLARKK